MRSKQKKLNLQKLSFFDMMKKRLLAILVEIDDSHQIAANRIANNDSNIQY